MGKLWSFTDNSGSFRSSGAAKIKSLYLPLANENIMSSVTPDLHGDIKSGQSSFLLIPVSRIDLQSLRSSRNFWVRIGRGKIWSAAGVSKDIKQIKQDEFCLEAGMLWQRATRQNRGIGLKASILSFVPATGEPAEIMQVELTNISPRPVNLTPFAAIPMYARSADNLRDHRHVTSLLQRIKLHKFGVMSCPNLIFDEAGHRKNADNYFVLGWDENGAPPQRTYPTQEIFCGDSGDLEAPEAVFGNVPAGPNYIQGKEAMGAFSFKAVTLKPGQSRGYTVIMGIARSPREIAAIAAGFDRPAKITVALRKTKEYWEKVSRGINIRTQDRDFDNWLRWVNIQPLLRKIFGCSFLPDFDYGKGGRGWRDLWQDCLGLILNDPRKVRGLLIDNFCGVKIDGSNATIIGKSPGEFIADRNNISRVWMDHGIWPLLTLELYINETGDFDILFEEATYFRNHEIKRAGEIDSSWSSVCGNKLKTKSGKIYSGSILEHLLVENLVQFFNVGSHNHIRLEGGDWNDGLDMAKDGGESVTFSAMYAQNLETLSALLLKCGRKKIAVAEEIKVLLAGINYGNASAKRKRLEDYFSKVSSRVSGRKISIDAQRLAADLRAKAEWIKQHIRKTEWLKEGFFNGYYDNRRRRLEGRRGGRLRMTLAGQVFPIMSGTAYGWQVQKILRNVDKYLTDRRTGGIHLNTDFKSELHDLGRAFSFSYGDKENGAVFSHMAVMFGYALYKQGYAEGAWKVLTSLYKMALDTGRSKIYPCLPEYFDLEGRGMYSYLTGSASWFMLTMLTQVFGVKGREGDLAIEPKLSAGFFLRNSEVSIERSFAGRRIKIVFSNPLKLDYGKYRISRVVLNSEELPIDESRYLVITREVILDLPSNKPSTIEIHLG